MATSRGHPQDGPDRSRDIRPLNGGTETYKDMLDTRMATFGLCLQYCTIFKAKARPTYLYHVKQPTRSAPSL